MELKNNIKGDIGMQILRYLPEINVIYEDGDDVLCTEVKTMQNFNEDEDTLTLQFAEFNPVFKRGLVCDLQYEFDIEDQFGNKTGETHTGTLYDLVLVYTNKECSMECTPQFTYVFYK